MEVIVCTSRTTESKKVSPKICLQRLPLPLQMRLPVEKRVGLPMGQQDNEETLSSTKPSCTEEDLEISESPRKRAKIECSNHEAEDSAQHGVIVNKDDGAIADEQEIQAKSTMDHLQMIMPSSLLTEKAQPSENQPSRSCSHIPGGCNVEKDTSLAEQQQQLSPKDMEQKTSHSLAVVFSEEDDDEFETDEGRMMDTQISKQIDKVQVFLKMDRLRRPKKQ